MTRRVWLALAAGAAHAQTSKHDGYRGIWYMNQPIKSPYRYKYSGGFATYPQQHVPIACHDEEAGKTFFVFGGTVSGRQELLHLVSYYDHATGLAPRPTLLLNKHTEDAHDNPTLMLDADGYLWVFSNAHGTSRPAFIHRSRKPRSIDDFELVGKTNFSYSQPWFLPGRGFLVLHTRYRDRGRSLFWMTSRDGRAWSEPRLLARMELGHYQVSWRQGGRVGTAFNFHPSPVGLNQRTNLYYLETRDGGETWQTADGKTVTPPLEDPANAALVHDFRAERKLVYLKDLQFDHLGRPVILFETSNGWEPGPQNDPRWLQTACWNGNGWDLRPFTTVDHNYDYGSLYLEEETRWRFIGPTEPGPQMYGTGGEMALWISRDQGRKWTKTKTLTRHSRFNHTYARRPVNAHPDFYALWADGDAFGESESSLYFTDREGSRVWRLPRTINTGFARPEPL